MPKERRIWDEIKTEYVTGNMSLRQLAEKRGIPLRSVQQRSTKDGYVQAREEYRAKVWQKVAEESERRDVAALSRLMTATERLTGIVGEAMSEDTIYGYLSTGLPEYDDETGEKKPGGLEIKRLSKADTRAIVNLSNAIKNLAAATREIYPDATAADGQQNGVVIMPNRLSEEEENDE